MEKLSLLSDWVDSKRHLISVILGWSAVLYYFGDQRIGCIRKNYDS